jgi:bifunctional DNA-binding transcriptional regulator/antitoxin component of YhaV-PrlF toxin-antitoxin module
MTYRTKIQGGQIVVPSRLRRLVGLVEGDPLVVKFEQGKLIVIAPGGRKKSQLKAARKQTPKQRREEFLQKLRNSAPAALKKIWGESERKGTNRITLHEINSEIAASRREKRQKLEAIARTTR